MVFVILSKLDLSFVGKLVAEGKSKKRRGKHRISQLCFFFVIIIFTVTGRDSEACLHTSESSFAYQTHGKADGVRASSMCDGCGG